MLSEIITSKKVNSIICSELNNIFSSRDTFIRVYRQNTKQECRKIIASYILLLQRYCIYKNGKGLKRDVKYFLKCYDQFLFIFTKIITGKVTDMYNCLFITNIWIAVLTALEKEAKKCDDTFLFNL